MEALTTGVSSLFDIVGTTITSLTGQPILMVFFSAGLIGTSIAVIRKFKKA